MIIKHCVFTSFDKMELGDLQAGVSCHPAGFWLGSNFVVANCLSHFQTADVTSLLMESSVVCVHSSLNHLNLRGGEIVF